MLNTIRQINSKHGLKCDTKDSTETNKNPKTVQGIANDLQPHIAFVKHDAAILKSKQSMQRAIPASVPKKSNLYASIASKVDTVTILIENQASFEHPIPRPFENQV